MMSSLLSEEMSFTSRHCQTKSGLVEIRQSKEGRNGREDRKHEVGWVDPEWCFQPGRNCKKRWTISQQSRVDSAIKTRKIDTRHRDQWYGMSPVRRGARYSFYPTISIPAANARAKREAWMSCVVKAVPVRRRRVCDLHVPTASKWSGTMHYRRGWGDGNQVQNMATYIGWLKLQFTFQTT